MPNRTYADLSGELDGLKSFYSSFARRYESIQESLTSEDVNYIIKEAILAGAWNAKGWYGINGYLHNYESLTAANWGQLHQQVNSVFNRLTNIDNKIDQVHTILQEAVEQNSNTPASAGFWGYAMGFAEWNDEIYEHLRLIDEIYGSTQTKSRDTLLALDQLYDFNESVTQILDRVESFDLPNFLNFSKSNHDINYEKIKITLFNIAKGTNELVLQNKITIFDVFSLNDLTTIQLPELQKGDYVLNIENKNNLNIQSFEKINDTEFIIVLNRMDLNLIGWFVNDLYPIIDFEEIDLRTYKIRLPFISENIQLTNVQEKYIEPISIILNVKEDKTDLVYDFFYGNYIDEFIQKLDNGNKIYYRTIKDTDNNPIAIYEMELDYNTTYNGGMPSIKYTRLDQ